MSLYSYKLHKNGEKEEVQNLYKEKNLKLMSTYQLREICNKEKLVKSIINPLDKDELIKLIMKYRGQKESKLINHFTIGGIERVERFLNRSHKDEIKNIQIDYPAKITIYENLSMDIYDNYIIKSAEDLQEANVILADDNYKVCTIFNLRKICKEDGVEYVLTKGADVEIKESENKSYKLLFFTERCSEMIYDTYEGDTILLDTSIKFTTCPLMQFEVKQIYDTKIPLAIDFGTSNTTAGIYINKERFSSNNMISHENDKNFEEEQIKLVKILDITKENYNITPIIPSVVGVKYINEDKIDYIFGYDAIYEYKKRYIDNNLTIFYDIKRWVSNYEKYEKVIDINEKTTLIKRKDIIKAYLEYIISLANQRFKCKFKNIYISCPSKQKYKFHSLFKDILNDYNVESENMLEESVAVLYNTISELIQKNKYVQDEKYKALIIDCGGGTTDLSGCSFIIKNNRISYELNIEESYENGDTDFGGNNLTFRIMQFIKVLMADTLLRNTNIKKQIIDKFKVDIFRYIDKIGINELYENLNKEYENAEEVIPTKFKLYESRSKEEYCKVRSNYYFLFNLAEQVKKVFFTNPDIMRIVLTPNKLGDNNKEIQYDKWKLSYLDNNILKLVREAPQLIVTTYEINTLIKGDVYNIIKKFLETLYENDELYEYSLIKLTGQSCKVDIFKDALKEFIPGKIIEVNRTKKQFNEEYELKLSCLKGSLKYLYDKNFGYADINIQSKTPTLPYTLTAYTHNGEEMILIKGKEVNKGFICRFNETHDSHSFVGVSSTEPNHRFGVSLIDKIMLKLYLKDSSNNVKYEYNYSFNNEELIRIDPKTICEKYSNINQHETDNIENNEVKFFVWAEEELWGFYVLAILRKEEELYIGKEKFFYFENDKWEQNFFDGLK